MVVIQRFCGDNWVTKRCRCWWIWRWHQDAVGCWHYIIMYDKQVGWGVAKSEDVTWLCWWELCWWWVTSWEKIGELHQCIRNDFRMADKWNINRGCVGVQGFSFCLSLLVLLRSKVSYDFETDSILALSWVPGDESRVSLDSFLISHCVTNISYVWPRLSQSGCYYYVKIGTFNHLEQSTICVLAVTSFGPVMWTIEYELIVILYFMQDHRDRFRETSQHVISIEEWPCYICHMRFPPSFTTMYPWKHSHNIEPTCWIFWDFWNPLQSWGICSRICLE